MRVVVKKHGFRATDEEMDAAIKTFTRKVKKSGLLKELRAREFYLKPGVKRRLKHENALKEKRKIQKKRGY